MGSSGVTNPSSRLPAGPAGRLVSQSLPGARQPRQDRRNRHKRRRAAVGGLVPSRGSLRPLEGGRHPAATDRQQKECRGRQPRQPDGRPPGGLRNGSRGRSSGRPHAPSIHEEPPSRALEILLQRSLNQARPDDAQPAHFPGARNASGTQRAAASHRVRSKLRLWPRRGSNPHTPHGIRDFKSRASASFATRPPPRSYRRLPSRRYIDPECGLN
ncbi:MAG: hypothetical protein RLZZ440_244 [Planctomycetota bacterium]